MKLYRDDKLVLSNQQTFLATDKLILNRHTHSE